jgi:hypothetical protein
LRHQEKVDLDRCQGGILKVAGRAIISSEKAFVVVDIVHKQIYQEEE